jgi:hypothetical protein
MQATDADETKNTLPSGLVNSAMASGRGYLWSFKLRNSAVRSRNCVHGVQSRLPFQSSVALLYRKETDFFPHVVPVSRGSHDQYILIPSAA